MSESWHGDNYENNVLSMLELSNGRKSRFLSLASFVEALEIPSSTAWSYLSGLRGNLRQVAGRFRYDVSIRRTWSTSASTYAWQMAAVHRGWG